MNQSLEKAGKALMQYKYLVIVILAGLLLLLWPKGAGPPETAAQASSSLEQMEQKLAQTLSRIEGVGKAEVMLTLQTDWDGSPRFQGALIVCDGAGDARMRMLVLDAVAALTGLRSDVVTVVKHTS